jgi:hypothetical protein
LRSLIGGDDVLHQTVADHVFFAEKDKLDVFDIPQNLLRLLETGARASGEIDLRDIAGDHRLGAVPEAGEEHLHLLGGGVLCLIKNHE